MNKKYYAVGNSFEYYYYETSVLYSLVVLPEELLGLASGSDPANENGKEKYQKLNHQSISVYQYIQNCIINVSESEPEM